MDRVTIDTLNSNIKLGITYDLWSKFNFPLLSFCN